MDNFNFDFDSKVPGIAKGTVPPPRAGDDKERKKEHRQFRHDWRLAIFTTIVGALCSRPLWAGIDALISAIMPG